MILVISKSNSNLINMEALNEDNNFGLGLGERSFVINQGKQFSVVY